MAESCIENNNLHFSRVNNNEDLVNKNALLVEMVNRAIVGLLEGDFYWNNFVFRSAITKLPM